MNNRRRGSGWRAGVRARLSDQKFCGICSGSLRGLGRGEIHIDHIVPIVHGGTDDISNLRLTHSWCNDQRGSKMESNQSRQIIADLKGI